MDADLFDNDGLCHVTVRAVGQNRPMDLLNGVWINLWHWDDLGILSHDVGREDIPVNDWQGVGPQLVTSSIHLAYGAV